MLVNMSGWNFESLSRVTTSYPFFLKTGAVDPVPENRSSIRRVLGGPPPSVSALYDRDLDGEGFSFWIADEDDAWSGSFEHSRIESDELLPVSELTRAGVWDVEVCLPFPLERPERGFAWADFGVFESVKPIGTD